jgi:hypothetical protein
MTIAGLPEDATIETPEGVRIEREVPLSRHSKPTDAVLVPVVDPPRVVRVTNGDGTTQVPAKRFVGAGWIVFDVLTGFVPLIIDAATSSWYEYEDTSMAAGKRVSKPASAR